MYRRTFLKIAMISSAGFCSFLKANFAFAKGIPSGVLGGAPPDKCYVAPAKGPIQTSLTDLFKVGPGPSSSHTIAPLRISSNFLQTAEGLP
ncbi:MAG: hypothetical protein N2Z74_06620, partial [Syntrophales bacterium]|nr:hypothetical protein [Syntrophales bacterium]